jgi:hypothetical protein
MFEKHISILPKVNYMYDIYYIRSDKYYICGEKKMTWWQVPLLWKGSYSQLCKVKRHSDDGSR